MPGTCWPPTVCFSPWPSGIHTTGTDSLLQIVYPDLVQGNADLERVSEKMNLRCCRLDHVHALRLKFDPHHGREVAAESSQSGDCCIQSAMDVGVMLHLEMKAFAPGKRVTRFWHIDTNLGNSATDDQRSVTSSRVFARGDVACAYESGRNRAGYNPFRFRLVTLP